jgi:hypothetical protein
MGHRSEYDEVPAAADDAEPDPHWAELLLPTAVPASYLPPSMSGPQPRWRRVSALVLLTLLVTVTAGGVCLTYGPAELFELLQ